MRHHERNYYGLAMLTVIASIIIVLLLVMTLSTPAATSQSYRLAIANVSSYGFTDMSNAYLIITDIRTGDMYDSTGSVQTTYASAAIPFAVDAQNTDWALCTMPALPTGKDYAIIIYENATPTMGDEIKAGPFLYDEMTGMTYTDLAPTTAGRVRISSQ